MDSMPRPRPPHLHPQISRHGKTVWYFRRGHGRRIRIGADFGMPEFEEQYQAALTGAAPLPRPKIGGPPAGSLAWLVEQYRGTTAWQNDLSKATRRQRENIFKHVLASAGTKPFTAITPAIITAGRERRGQTPAHARNYLDAMRGLFRWALEAKHVKTDPTAGVKNPTRKAGPGFVAWTEDHVTAYRKRWKIGTRERVWLEVLLQTGLRRGDAVTFGKQHVRTVEVPGGTIKVGVVNTEKSEYEIPAIFPVTPALEDVLKAGPCADLTFICGAAGGALTKETFGNDFRAACRAAKVPGSAHGLRKLASIRAAHKGATTAQMRALFGWTTDSMPALYTKAADRMRLAIEGALVLANDSRTSIPSPMAAGEGLRGKK